MGSAVPSHASQIGLAECIKLKMANILSTELASRSATVTNLANVPKRAMGFGAHSNGTLCINATDVWATILASHARTRMFRYLALSNEMQRARDLERAARKGANGPRTD